MAAPLPTETPADGAPVPAGRRSWERVPLGSPVVRASREPDAGATASPTPSATPSNHAPSPTPERASPAPVTAAASDPAEPSPPIADSASPLHAPPPASPGATSHLLPDAIHVWQKWNNCGPATVLMAISAFGPRLDQMAVAASLKPDREDTNVTPDELAAFARSQGLAALVRVHGDRDVVRALLRVGVPVIAEQWIDVAGRGEMGHYRVVIGFDDDRAEVVVHDSYYGAARRHGYDDFERMWRPFAGAYVVLYLPEQEAAVRAAIGADWADAAMWARARADLEAAAAGAPEDPWAWVALGEVRSRQGDHAAALEAFEQARRIGLPFRAFWYQFGYYRSAAATGAWDRILALADATLEGMKGENLEESRYWRGVALRHLGREDEARADFETALRFNPLFASARDALVAGPP